MAITITHEALQIAKADVQGLGGRSACRLSSADEARGWNAKLRTYRRLQDWLEELKKIQASPKPRGRGNAVRTQSSPS